MTDWDRLEEQGREVRRMIKRGEQVAFVVGVGLALCVGVLWWWLFG